VHVLLGELCYKLPPLLRAHLRACRECLLVSSQQHCCRHLRQMVKHKRCRLRAGRCLRDCVRLRSGAAVAFALAPPDAGFGGSGFGVSVQSLTLGVGCRLVIRSPRKSQSHSRVGLGVALPTLHAHDRCCKLQTDVLEATCNDMGKRQECRSARKNLLVHAELFKVHLARQFLCYSWVTVTRSTLSQGGAGARKKPRAQHSICA
jgi:hypothetical protein